MPLFLLLKIALLGGKEKEERSQDMEKGGEKKNLPFLPGTLLYNSGEQVAVSETSFSILIHSFHESSQRKFSQLQHRHSLKELRFFKAIS